MDSKVLSFCLWCVYCLILSGTTLSADIRYSNLPESYVRPESERPRLSKVSQCEDVPVIDLGCEDRGQIIQQIRDACIIQQIGDACTVYGLFQVINHGVSGEAIEKMLGVANEFIRLPVEENMKLYSDDPSKTMRLSTSFIVNKEKVHNWRDYLRLYCYPLEQYVPEWPSNPPSFKDIVSNYCTEVRQLGSRLQGLISESSGLPGHTDPNALTILLQDLQAAGLQVLEDGNWVSVNPHPDAFVIKVGDQLQALTRWRYVWHPTIPNTEARLLVAYFHCPCDDAQISPAKVLTDDGSVTIYRSSTHGGIPADHGDILAANSGNPGAQAAEAQAGGSSTREPSSALFRSLPTVFRELFRSLPTVFKELFRSLPTDFKDWLKEVVQSSIVSIALEELVEKVVNGTTLRERVRSGMIIMVIMALRKYL